MTECDDRNAAGACLRPLAPHICGGPPGHAMPHGCRCGMSWGYPLVSVLDRVAFLCLWARRSGVSRGNIRGQWDEMPEWERAEVYAWARQELEQTEAA